MEKTVFVCIFIIPEMGLRFSIFKDFSYILLAKADTKLNQKLVGVFLPEIE